MLHNYRQSYNRHRLDEVEINEDPIAQFALWFSDAEHAGMIEPNAMMLATAGADGRISNRVVLLKSFSESGFTFFTNYHSLKGRQMAEQPLTALTFWWDKLERQVRIEGPIEKVPEAESDAYFNSRPHGHQVGAWVSPQSEVVPDRKFLEDRYTELAAQYAGKLVPRPSHWGGYLLLPDRIEFWQGRPNRLHDRIEYLRQGDGSWTNNRLAP